jgi:hypothetical protein
MPLLARGKGAARFPIGVASVNAAEGLGLRELSATCAFAWVGLFVSLAQSRVVSGEVVASGVAVVLGCEDDGRVVVPT